MKSNVESQATSILLVIAGAKGAIGTTLAAAAANLCHRPQTILPSLTTTELLHGLDVPVRMHVAGWDVNTTALDDLFSSHGVLPEALWRPFADELRRLPVLTPPQENLLLEERVKRLCADIRSMRRHYPGARAVFVNLLPAAPVSDLSACTSLEALYGDPSLAAFTDLAYVLAALQSGLPVVNFTPNDLELPLITAEAAKRQLPMAGCDGKTGQTYFKVVLASAFKARNLAVDGWYSLNILGNADGKNLMDPERAACKIANKTELLDEILEYPVGKPYGCCTHKVHIAYYPPRGDAKEAWDVIDFKGLFGLPMSLRLNLQGRDSILAAPLVMDLARWMTVLKRTGRSGSIPELGFYFKRPKGPNPPLTFQDQVRALQRLAQQCRRDLGSDAA